MIIVSEKEKKESDKNGNIDKKMGDTDSEKLESGGSAIPCMDRLREELSCAVSSFPQLLLVS